MAECWLFKTEPSAYSFAHLVRDKRTVWDGVKNPMALKYLRQVRGGDTVLIYHTGDEKAVVGIGKALGDAYADPRGKDERLAVVDVAPVAALPRPVTLAEIKKNPTFREWQLVRLPRLSVMPVSREQRAAVERLAGD